MKASRWVAVALFAVGAVAMIEAQQPGRGGGFGRVNVTTQVVSNKDLQAELKVTDAQLEKLKVVADKQAEMAKKRGEAFKDAAGDKDKLKDLFTDLQKDTEKMTEEVTKVVEETLTADQKKRLKQIERQVLGVRAFADEQTVADLKLNDTQKGKIKGIADDYAKDSRELFGGGGKGNFGKGGFDKEKAAENQKKREKLTKAAMADIDEVLTDDQRKAWKELVGAPFDTSKLNQFGGFGFGGGGFGKKKD